MGAPRPGAGTPLPWRRLAVLLPAFLGDALAICAVFPFLPFMVQDLMGFPPQEQHRIGYYAGLLGGAFEFGQILSSPAWGVLADRRGRRPALLLSLLLGQLLFLAFGLSGSFGWALALRFGQGLASGTMGVGRAYIADITDATNETEAFALLGIVWGAGDILGPILGGLLSEPARQHPGWCARLPAQLCGLLAARPYFLPCAAVSAVGALDFLLVLGLLPESQARAEAPPERGGATAPWLAGWRALRANPSLGLACAVSLAFGCSISAYDTVAPVWARDQLRLSPEHLGAVQSATGIVSLLASYFVVTRLVRACGHSTAMCLTLLVVALGYLAPAVDIVAGLRRDAAASTALLCASYGLKALGCEGCFTGMTMLLVRSSTRSTFATAQGVGSAFLSTGLAVGPLWGPPLYAAVSGMQAPPSSSSLSSSSSSPPSSPLLAAPFVVLALLSAASAALTRRHAALLAAGGGPESPGGAGPQEPLL